MDAKNAMDGIHAFLLGLDPWRIAGGIAVALLVRFIIQSITKPKNVPPFYYEMPYLPWLGSLVQFATGPREFLQRAAMAKGDAFSIQLFGKTMTFLTGSEGKENEETKCWTSKGCFADRLQHIILTELMPVPLLLDFSFLPFFLGFHLKDMPTFSRQEKMYSIFVRHMP